MIPSLVSSFSVKSLLPYVMVFSLMSMAMIFASAL